MKQFVFAETRVFVIPAETEADAYATMTSGDADDYLVDMDVEFKGEE